MFLILGYVYRCLYHSCQVIRTDFVYMVFFQCVYVFSIFMCSYDVHCICSGSICIYVFNMWLEYPELLLLLFPIVCIYSLRLVWNVPSVGPMYLVESLGISFGRCHFCCACLFVFVVLLCFVLCMDEVAQR
jgi:hypothetical protein